MRSAISRTLVNAFMILTPMPSRSTRATVPATFMTRSTDSGWGSVGASSTLTGRITGCRERRSAPSVRTPTSTSISLAGRGSGVTNTAPFRSASSSTRTPSSRSSPSPKPCRGTSSSSAASPISTHSGPTSERRSPTSRPASSPGTRLGSRSSRSSGARTLPRPTTGSRR